MAAQIKIVQNCTLSGANDFLRGCYISKIMQIKKICFGLWIIYRHLSENDQEPKNGILNIIEFARVCKFHKTYQFSFAFKGRFLFNYIEW